MTTARALKNTDYNAVKTATRALIKAAGGNESAATYTNKCKSVLSNYANPNQPNYFMPLDVVADLEEATGCYAVTQTLARLSGHVLLPCISDAADDSIFSQLASIGKEVGDVFAKAQQAYEDGKIDTHESTELAQEIDEAVTVLMALRASVKVSK